MKNSKGQFMIISAVIASIIVIGLSTTISNTKNQDYNHQTLSKTLNEMEIEAKKITKDGKITSKEKENFRKLINYENNYATTAEFNESENCVTLTLESTKETIETRCIN
jgi:hypothetical protein